ncbi:hypothetical protein [Bacillus sp. FSL K6-2841]
MNKNVIYQRLPLNENEWHVGNDRGTGYMKSIGMELWDINFRNMV